MLTIRSDLAATQFVGSLLGQCLGDALGFVVEGQSPAVCRSYVDEVIDSGRRMIARPGFLPGQYTDDSQLARELLISVVSCEGFDPADYARRIANLFSQRLVVGHGRATAEAARRLTSGVPWKEAGTPPPAAGNGSAMRAGAVGLLFAQDRDALVRAACHQGQITHRDARCSAGACAIAAAVAIAATRAPIDVVAFATEIADLVAPVENGVAAAITRLPELVAWPPDDAAEQVLAISEGDHKDAWSGISPYVVPSVLWSLYAFARSPDDYWQTILTAIAVGGDVDTTAAMAGAEAERGSA